MKGIDAAFCGRLGRDAEHRTTRSGKAMTILAVGVDGEAEGETTWAKALASKPRRGDAKSREVNESLR